jgi:hypothetical protein
MLLLRALVAAREVLVLGQGQAVAVLEGIGPMSLVSPLVEVLPLSLP